MHVLPKYLLSMVNCVTENMFDNIWKGYFISWCNLIHDKSTVFKVSSEIEWHLWSIIFLLHLATKWINWSPFWGMPGFTNTQIQHGNLHHDSKPQQIASHHWNYVCVGCVRWPRQWCGAFPVNTQIMITGAWIATKEIFILKSMPVVFEHGFWLIYWRLYRQSTSSHIWDVPAWTCKMRTLDINITLVIRKTWEEI